MVAIHKAKMAGDGYLVEDTILVVDGKEMVDIRFKLNDLEMNDAIWVTTLALNQDGYIYLYEGTVGGTIDFDKYKKASFGFDSIFTPDGIDKTLYELGDDKKLFSARNIAIQNLKENNYSFMIKTDRISEWQGKWQNS